MAEALSLELYFLIIHHVDDKSDLCSLSLCCSAFRDEAQRCLFRHVDLRSINQQPQQRLFISTVNSAPLRFGPLVHTFRIEETWWDYHDLAISLSTALRAMCGLKHLELLYGRPSPILRGCSFSLHSFTIDRGTVFRDELVFLLCEFLPTQHHIRHLELVISNQIYDVNPPAGLCPQLDSFGSNGDSLVGAFLPESKLISHFQWHGFPMPPPLTTRQLNYLRSIRFNAGIINTMFTQHLTSLVYLELVLTIANVDSLLHDLQFLRNIPRLQVLLINTVNWPFPMPDEEFSTLFSVGFRLAFELCPKLKYIDVGRGDPESASWERFVRPTIDEYGDLVWKRHAAKPEDVRAWRL